MWLGWTRRSRRRFWSGGNLFVLWIEKLPFLGPPRGRGHGCGGAGVSAGHRPPRRRRRIVVRVEPVRVEVAYDSGRQWGLEIGRRIDSACSSACRRRSGRSARTSCGPTSPRAATARAPAPRRRPRAGPAETRTAGRARAAPRPRCRCRAAPLPTEHHQSTKTCPGIWGQTRRHESGRRRTSQRAAPHVDARYFRGRCGESVPSPEKKTSLTQSKKGFSGILLFFKGN